MATSFTKSAIRNMGVDADRKVRHGRKPGEGRVKFAAGTLKATASMTCGGSVIRASDRTDA